MLASAVPSRSDASPARAHVPPAAPATRLLRVGAEEAYMTIEEALGTCVGGEAVLIGAGRYELRAPLVVGCSLTLEGEGEVCVVGTGALIEWRRGDGALRNLRLMQRVHAEDERAPLLELIGGDLLVQAPSTNLLRTFHQPSTNLPPRLELIGADLLVQDCELHARGGAAVFAHGMPRAHLRAWTGKARYDAHALAKLAELVERGERRVRLPPH